MDLRDLSIIYRNVIKELYSVLLPNFTYSFSERKSHIGRLRDGFRGCIQELEKVEHEVRSNIPSKQNRPSLPIPAYVDSLVDEVPLEHPFSKQLNELKLCFKEIIAIASTAHQRELQIHEYMCKAVSTSGAYLTTLTKHLISATLNDHFLPLLVAYQPAKISSGPVGLVGEYKALTEDYTKYAAKILDKTDDLLTVLSKFKLISEEDGEYCRDLLGMCIFDFEMKPEENIIYPYVEASVNKFVLTYRTITSKYIRSAKNTAKDIKSLLAEADRIKDTTNKAVINLTNFLHHLRSHEITADSDNHFTITHTCLEIRQRLLDLKPASLKAKSTSDRIHNAVWILENWDGFQKKTKKFLTREQQILQVQRHHQADQHIKFCNEIFDTMTTIQQRLNHVSDQLHNHTLYVFTVLAKLSFTQTMTIERLWTLTVQHMNVILKRVHILNSQISGSLAREAHIFSDFESRLGFDIEGLHAYAQNEFKILLLRALLENCGYLRFYIEHCRSSDQNIIQYLQCLDAFGEALAHRPSLGGELARANRS